LDRPIDDFEDVVEAMVKYRDSLPGFEFIIFMYFFCGGAMKMVYSAGQVRALHKLGFGWIAESVVAISSGAAVAAYFLAGWEQTKRGCSLLVNGIPKYMHPGFQNIGRIIDADGIENELRFGENALDVDRVMSSLTKLYVGVMDRKTGQYLIQNVCAGDAISWMKAAMNLLWISKGRVIINGREYADAGAYVVDLKATIGQLDRRPTHILILPSEAAENLPPAGPIYRFYDWLTFKIYPDRKEQMEASRFDKVQAQIDWCHENGIKVGILWPEKVAGISNFTRSPRLLEEACRRSEAAAESLFVNTVAGLKEVGRI